MAITHEDIQFLKKEFDDRYVLQKDCNEIQEGVNKKFANDHEQIALILAEQKAIRAETKQMREETKNSLKFNNWLTTAVLGCIIVGIVTFLYYNFGG